MKNKKIILGLTTLIAITSISTACGQKAELKDVAEVAVSINGEKITATEYYNEIKKSSISQLVDMIDHKLFDEKYPSDEEETEAIDQQISQMKSSYQNEELFLSFIQQYFGVNNEDELREMLSLEYKRNEAVNDYIKENLTDKEIEDYYNQNIIGDIKAKHILIAPDVSDDATDEEKTEAEEKALKKAQNIIKKLEDGQDFEELAKKYSDDEATAESGGELGYFQADEMVEEFADAVKELENGEYTKEPIKTKFGYHIILKEDQKEKAELEEVEDDIKETLTENKLTEDSSLHYQKLIDIREENKITWKDDELKEQYEKYMDQLIETAKSTTAS